MGGGKASSNGPLQASNPKHFGDGDDVSQLTFQLYPSYVYPEFPWYEETNLCLRSKVSSVWALTDHHWRVRRARRALWALAKHQHGADSQSCQANYTPSQLDFCFSLPASKRLKFDLGLPSPLLSCLHCLSHFPLTSHTDGHGWWLVLVDPLILQPRASRPYHISWSWTEDWQQKKDRYQRRPGRGRPPEAGELLSRALPPSPLLVKSVSCLRLRQTSPEVSPCKTQRRECEEDPAGPRTVEHHSLPLEVFLLRFELR